MCVAIEAVVPALKTLTPELIFGGIADTGYMQEGMFEQIGAFLLGCFRNSMPLLTECQLLFGY